MTMKIGDKVRVVDLFGDSSEGCRQYIGKVGIIDAICSHPCQYPIEVCFENLSRMWFRLSELRIYSLGVMETE